MAIIDPKDYGKITSGGAGPEQNTGSFWRETAKAVPRVIGGIVESAGTSLQGLREMGNAVSATPNVGGVIPTHTTPEGIRKWGEEFKSKYVITPEFQEAHPIVTKGAELAEGVARLAPLMIMPGAQVAFPAAFGTEQYQRSLETGVAGGMSSEEAHKKAFAPAAVAAAGAALMGPVARVAEGLVAPAAITTAGQIVKPGFRQIAKNVLAGTAADTGMMQAQGLGVAEAEKVAAIRPEAEPVKEVLLNPEAWVGAALTGGMFRGISTAKGLANLSGMRKSLEDVDTPIPQRMQVAAHIEAQIRKTNPAEADKFGTAAKEAILGETPRPIPLGTNTLEQSLHEALADKVANPDKDLTQIIEEKTGGIKEPISGLPIGAKEVNPSYEDLVARENELTQTLVKSPEDFAALDQIHTQMKDLFLQEHKQAVLTAGAESLRKQGVQPKSQQELIDAGLAIVYPEYDKYIAIPGAEKPAPEPDRIIRPEVIGGRGQRGEEIKTEGERNAIEEGIKQEGEGVQLPGTELGNVEEGPYRNEPGTGIERGGEETNLGDNVEQGPGKEVTPVLGEEPLPEPIPPEPILPEPTLPTAPKIGALEPGVIKEVKGNPNIKVGRSPDGDTLRVLGRDSKGELIVLGEATLDKKGNIKDLEIFPQATGLGAIDERTFIERTLRAAAGEGEAPTKGKKGAVKKIKPVPGENPEKPPVGNLPEVEYTPGARVLAGHTEKPVDALKGFEPQLAEALDRGESKLDLKNITSLANLLYLARGKEANDPTNRFGGKVEVKGNKVGERVLSVERPYGKLVLDEATKTLKAELPEKAFSVSRVAGGAKFTVDTTNLLQTMMKDIVNNDLEGTVTNELIQNALDAFPKGAASKNIRITTRRETDPVSGGRDVAIVVQDNGGGMTRAEMEKNFLGLGAKGKSGTDTRGGYGLAKAAFLLAPKSVEVTTTKDGVTTTLRATREDLMDGKQLDITTRQAAEGETGTTVNLLMYGDSDTAKAAGTFSADAYRLDRVINNYISKIRTPVNIETELNAGFGKIETYSPTELKHEEHQYKPSKVKILGNELTVYFIKDDGSTARKDRNGKYDIEAETYNKGLLLQGIDPRTYYLAGMYSRPNFKVYVEFDKTPDVKDPNYPFIKNRTEINREVASKVQELVNEKITALNKGAFEADTKEFKKMIDEAPEISKVKILMPFKDPAEKKIAAEIFKKNKALFTDIAGIYDAFKNILKGAGEKDIDLAVTVEPGVHGYRSNPAVVGHEIYAINPFSVTEALMQNPRYKGFVDEGNDPNFLKASNFVHTLVHEYTHNYAQEHYEDFTIQLGVIYGKLTHTQLSALEEQLYDFYQKHGDSIGSISKDLSVLGKGGSRFRTDASTVRYSELAGGRAEGLRAAEEGGAGRGEPEPSGAQFELGEKSNIEIKEQMRYSPPGGTKIEKPGYKGEETQLVAKIDGKDVGRLWLEPKDGGFYVHRVDTDASVRGQGVAEKLYQQAFDTYGPWKGSTAQTTGKSGGEGFVKAMRDKHPDWFGEGAREEAAPSETFTSAQNAADFTAAVNKFFGTDTHVFRQVEAPNEKVASVITKIIGKELVFMEQKGGRTVGINGMVLNDNRIFVLKGGAGGFVTGTVIHEAFHQLEIDYPELYMQLAKDLSGVVSAEGVGKYRDNLNAMRAKTGVDPLSNRNAAREFISDIAHDQAYKPEFWDRLVQKAPDAIKRIYDSITDLIQRIKEGLGVKGGRGTNQYLINAEKVRDIMADSLAKYMHLVQGKEPAEFVKEFDQKMAAEMKRAREPFYSKVESIAGERTFPPEAFPKFELTAQSIAEDLKKNPFIEQDVVPALTKAVKSLKETGDQALRFVAPGARSKDAKTTQDEFRGVLGEMWRKQYTAASKLDEVIKGVRNESSTVSSVLDLMRSQGKTLADSYFARMGNEASWDFMFRMDKGAPQEDAIRTAVADFTREQVNSRVDAIQKLGTGLLAHIDPTAEDGNPYFPRYWEKPDEALKAIRVELSKRPLQGRMAFNNKRVFDDIYEGHKLGYKLVSNNPMDLLFMKLGELDKYIAAHTMLQNLERDGVAKLHPVGEALPRGEINILGVYGSVKRKTEPASPEVQKAAAQQVHKLEGVNRRLEKELVIAQDTFGENSPEHQTASDALMSAKEMLSTANAKWTEAKGGWKSYKYGVRDDAAQVINNYLSPSLYNNKYVGNVFTGYMNMANQLNQFQLGVGSFFHAGFTSIETVVSEVALGLKAAVSGDIPKAVKHFAKSPAAWINNPMSGAQILKGWAGGDVSNTNVKNMPLVLEGLALAGARKNMDARFATNVTEKMFEAWANGNKLGAAVRAPFAFVEQMARPIMEWLVPRQKFGVFGEMYNYWLEEHPNSSATDRRQAAGEIWNRVDSRLGQVVYDRLFVNNVAKNLTQATLRAPGWTGGTILELGGGVKDLAGLLKDLATGKKPVLTDRAAYTVGLVLVTAVTNGILTTLFTGEEPEGKDFLAFRTGNTDENGFSERFMLPTYMKDLHAYAEDTTGTLVNKLHPAIGMLKQAVSNKDYYGVEIRKEGDNIAEQFGQLLGFGFKQYVPFWMRGLAKEQERGGSGLAQTLPFIGVMPAPSELNRTEAEKLTRRFMQARTPNMSKTTAEAERSKKIRELTKAARAGAPDISTLIEEAVRNGELSTQAAKMIVNEAQSSPLQAGFRRLSLAEAAKIMEVATPEEAEELKILYQQKQARWKKQYPYGQAGVE